MPNLIAPSQTTYRGVLTTPERWNTWSPRDGDILVCTPPKCGTTWTQTMLAMLLNGGPDLPDTLGAISPWVDANLGIDAQTVQRTIAALPGRRVMKTHTPADGFSIWDSVRIVAVYRHPLDVFFSLRTHIANRHVGKDHPFMAPLSTALGTFLNAPMDPLDFDTDSLASITHHYLKTARAPRGQQQTLLHYSDMIRDPRAALIHLARENDIRADDALIAGILEATSLPAMRKQADQYAPAGGTGFFKNDADFFATGGTGNWQGHLSAQDFEHYKDRLSELVPNAEDRRWLENGTGAPLR